MATVAIKETSCGIAGPAAAPALAAASIWNWLRNASITTLCFQAEAAGGVELAWEKGVDQPVVRQRERRVLRGVEPLKSPGHDAVRRIHWQGALRTGSLEKFLGFGVIQTFQFASARVLPIFPLQIF
jgi:hypothetical protein